MTIENREGLKQEVEIRTATPEDVREIAEVLRDSWLQTYPNEKYGIKRDVIEEQWKQLMTDEGLAIRAEEIRAPRTKFTHFLVARADGKIVGMCRFDTSDVNYVGSLYVHPEYQSRGIGKTLLEEAEKRFDPAKDTFLSVAPYNENAKRLFSSLGFERTSRPIDRSRGILLIDESRIPVEEMRRPARKQL